jgi:hypothetical protein
VTEKWRRRGILQAGTVSAGTLRRRRIAAGWDHRSLEAGSPTTGRALWFINLLLQVQQKVKGRRDHPGVGVNAQFEPAE